MTTPLNGVLLAALLTWVFAPIAMLIVRALAESWRFPQIWPEAVLVSSALVVPASGRLVSALATSLGLAGLTGFLGAILGFTLARTSAHSNSRYRQLTVAAAFFIVIAPPIALGVGLQVTLLALGVGGTFVGVLLAHLVPATGYLTLFAAGVFASLDRSFEDEARTLGASPWQVLSRVLVPLLARRFGEALMLGALVSWAQLALTLVVGGGLVRTLPLELLSLIQSGNDRVAAVAALLLSAPLIVGIGLLTVGVRRTGASL
jgi:putative spermidine/putrescine transport system permease protein